MSFFSALSSWLAGPVFFFPRDCINPMVAKSAKSAMNGRALQAKHTTLADDAHSKAFSLEKELLAAM